MHCTPRRLRVVYARATRLQTQKTPVRKFVPVEVCATGGDALHLPLFETCLGTVLHSQAHQCRGLEALKDLEGMQEPLSREVPEGTQERVIASLEQDPLLTMISMRSSNTAQLTAIISQGCTPHCGPHELEHTRDT